jgi:hypothetical protein
MDRDRRSFTRGLFALAVAVVVSSCSGDFIAPASEVPEHPVFSNQGDPFLLTGQIRLCKYAPDATGPSWADFEASAAPDVGSFPLGTGFRLVAGTTSWDEKCSIIWTPPADLDENVVVTITEVGMPAGMYTEVIVVFQDAVSMATVAPPTVNVTVGPSYGAIVYFKNRGTPEPAAPAIALVKLTNGTDNNAPTGPLVPVGSTVIWTYIVTNTGDVPLSEVSVADDQGVVVTCPATALAVGESMTCTGTGIAVAGQYANLGTATGSHNGTTVQAEDPDHYFGEEPGGAVLLIIDEDGIDNGLHVNRTGGGITPSGPSFWTDREVNDDIAAYGLRNVLRYFANSSNFGRTITVVTGQTGDEGWFAPNCIPAKWLNSSVSSSNNTCLEGADRTTAIHNYFFSGKTPFAGAPSPTWNIPQSRLDKIPHVMPLRARGLVSLEGKEVCALVYDSDISINYDHGKPLGVNGNLQGATYGIAAFRVNVVRTLNNFSSSTLPEVQITVLDPAATCQNFQLFNAPVPNSSSEPNDRRVESLAGLGTKAYRSFLVWPTLEMFF